MTSLQNLKLLVYILSFLLVFGCFCLKSCQSTPKKETLNEYAIVFSDFIGFPNYPFLQIDFDLPCNEIKNHLIENGFLQKDDYTFYRPTDSTNFIFINPDDSNGFIVYLKGQVFMKNQRDFYQLLKSKSVYSRGDRILSEFSFQTNENNVYFVTFFTTNDFIRLKYILKQ